MQAINIGEALRNTPHYLALILVSFTPIHRTLMKLWRQTPPLVGVEEFSSFGASPRATSTTQADIGCNILFAHVLRLFSPPSGCQQIPAFLTESN